jgi:hypothetical protein
MIPSSEKTGPVTSVANNTFTQDKQQSFIRRKHSIFSSNFSSNPDNIIIDQNYTMKGSNETQRIAWEIKFNQSYKKEKEETNESFQESQQRKQTKSFKVHSNRPVVKNTFDNS